MSLPQQAAPSAMVPARAVVLLGRGPGSERLAADLPGAGWRVLAMGEPAEGAAGDRLAAVLAAPGAPARVVVLGWGAAAAAASGFADRHPERVLAVVAIGAPEGAGPDAGDLDLLCPVLAVPAAGEETVVAPVLRFLAGLVRPAGPPAAPRRSAAVPALTPVLLNDPEVAGRLRAAGPVHRVDAPGIATTWLLTGHEATTTTLADPRLVGEVEITAGFRLQSADPALRHRGERDLITIDGQEHARLRRLVARHLTPARLAALRPRIQRETDALLDAIPAGQETDLLRSFARPLPIAVLCELCGVPVRDRDYVAEWLLDRMTELPPSAHSDVDDYFRALVRARRGRLAEDLLGWVVAAEGDRLAEDDLVAAVRLLLVGGHRAPTTLLLNGVAALLRERDQWEQIVADPALVVGAVEELLRLVTPFPVGLARHVAAPIDVGGTRIPAGDLVAASLVAANRDPACFRNPDALDVGRAANPHLAFGHGHHYCLGAALAREEARIAVGTLARRFPGMRLAHGSRDLHYRQSRVRYLLELPVVLEPERAGQRDPVAARSAE